MNFRTLESILFVIAGIALGWIARGCTHDCPPSISTPTTMITTIDTVVRVVPAEPIVIQAKPRVVRSREVVTYVDTVRIADSVRLDTVLRAQPFEMAIDTVSDRGDSITAIASFPPPSIALAIRPRPDTALDRTRVVVVDRPVPQQKAWYAEPARVGVYVGGGMVLGYVTRLLTEPECTRIQVGTTAPRAALVNVSLRF